VRADSAGAGRGAVFTVELPAATPVMLAVAAAAEQRRPPDEPGLDGARIWLVDDDTDAHEVVSLTLQQAGARVAAFGSCAELVAALGAVAPARLPQLLLIDLAMPDEDGFETLRRVRALETKRGAEGAVPAIALTAFTQIERERLLSAGFRDRVDKPVDADKLVAAIRAALQSEGGAAPTRRSAQSLIGGDSRSR
jgi:CheY-like chemotaxis protein